MFLDASLIIAIVARKRGWQEIVKMLETHDGSFVVSPIVRFEAVLGLARKPTDPGAPKRMETMEIAKSAIEAFLSAVEADEIPITAEMGSIAVSTAATYGKVVGHAADLNFGDCFSYACAKHLGFPLGYKGDDFALTDLA